MQFFQASDDVGGACDLDLFQEKDVTSESGSNKMKNGH